MAEYFEVWKTADSLYDLPPVPDFDDFAVCNRFVDVGYDIYMTTAYVYGPYALLYDSEEHGNDLWGWSAQISYMDGNRSTYAMACHKCDSALEAYEGLVDYIASL